MKLLIIDDKQEELEKAVRIGKEFGHEIITSNPSENYAEWVKLIGSVDAVITDLMFKPQGARCKEIPPAGLLVVIHAISLQKPVAICTSAGDEDKSWGHHGEIGWIYDKYIEIAKYSKCSGGLPFSFVEDKNWEWAIRSVENKIKK